MGTFFGYKHWTLEDPPRCFNVGKGVQSRANSTWSRNHKWHAIVKRFGLRVEVCIGPVTNDEACAWEMENVALMGTFSRCHLHDVTDDIGCNFTMGGEGLAGWKHSNETIEKMKKAHAGACRRGVGWHHSLETREKSSRAQRGKPRKKLSEETKQRLRTLALEQWRRRRGQL